jgi:WG repeat protein
MTRQIPRIAFSSLALLFISVFGFQFARANSALRTVGRDRQDARAPKENRMLFVADNGSVLIDATGRVVLSASDPQLIAEVRRVSAQLGGIRGRFEEQPGIRFEAFSEGLIVIGWALCPMCRNPFWVNAIINEQGQMVIEPKNGQTRYQGFHEGLAKFTGAGWGFIDSTGQDVIPAQFVETGNFSEGLAFVRATHKDRYGYLDRTGRLVIPYRFKYATDFREGLAVVILVGDLYGFIDRTGKVVLQSKAWQGVDHFSEGLALVRVSVTTNRMYRGQTDLQYGFIDRSGKFVIAPRFEYVQSFSEGRALFRVRDDDRRSYKTHHSDRSNSWGNAGFIDAQGQVVIQPKFVGAKNFSEGLAAVAIRSAGDKTLWGYIDRQGNWIIQPQFESASSFDGGLAAVNCDPYGRSCAAYVDKAGQIRWQK